MKLAIPLLAALICWGYTHPAYTPSQTARGSALRAHVTATHAARFLTTAYCDHGRTATGTYTRPGTIAVDPRVVPLRSLMSVPGYGRGQALDTGGAIAGRHVDVWFSRCDQARNWGARYRMVTWR